VINFGIGFVCGVACALAWAVAAFAYAIRNWDMDYEVWRNRDRNHYQIRKDE
jgi:hypothetical protein